MAMPHLDRRLVIITSAIAVLLLLIGFGVGRLTADDSPASGSAAAANPPGDAAGESESPSDSMQEGREAANATTISGDAAAALPPDLETPEEGIPVYGTEAEREALLTGLAESGVAGGTRSGLLATADHVCYALERLQAQGRTPAFAVRVVWNESLAELDSRDLAAFAAVFNAAPRYLCSESIDYAEDVAYWLGF